eukprot:COSAG02_NODE_595_length_19813_cov_12.215380_20_plen_640_part_00
MTYLYDIPVWVVDNCSGNRATNGLITMIDIVRRLEYKMLRDGCRRGIGPYIKTDTQSCQLHDSNLVNVQLSRFLLAIDRANGVGFSHSNSGSAGNKKTECFSMNLARWLAGCLKKDPTWSAYMLEEHGDDGGIPAVKSARFWSVMITMGQYMYPRLKYLQEFAQSQKARLSGTQLGNNLADMQDNFALFEFDCLLSAVDYAGFHSPFMYGAANYSSEKQAKRVQRVTEFHRRAGTDCVARSRYWAAHAKNAIVQRKLTEWKCDYWATHNKLPGKWKTQRQRAIFKRQLTEDAIQVPAQYERRVKSMHKAVVTKLEEHIGHLVETGKVPIGVKLTTAPSSNFPVECVGSQLLLRGSQLLQLLVWPRCLALLEETHWSCPLRMYVCRDVFQEGRRHQERSSILRIENQSALRRVRKAPPLAADGCSQYTIANPPAWYPQWMREDLKERARNIIANDWVSKRKRAQMRWRSTSELATWEATRALGREERTDRQADDVRAQVGGWVGDGEDAYQLPAMTLMTIAMYDQMSWSKDEMAKRKWTTKAIGNQMKLRNLPEFKQVRTKSVVDEYHRRKLLGRGESLRTSAKTTEELAKLLREVLEAEHIATAAEKAQAEARAAIEASEGRRARQSRKNRGENRYRPQ